MALTGEITGSLLASMSASGGVNGEIAFDGSGTDNYNELDNKPSINGVTLEGNKTSADLHIETGGTDNYNDLLNKPQINGATLTGNVTDTQLQIDYNHLINKPVIPDFSEIETRLDTAETDIDNLQSDMVTAQDDIATIKATDLTQNADINSLKNRVTGTETNISNLSTRVSSAETSISNHTTEISSIEDNVTGLDTRVGTAEGDIDTLQGDMTQAQSDISELNSSKANKQWTRVLQVDITSNTDQTVQVTYPDGYSELLFTIQRLDNGRTIGTNIIPKDQFNGGACYVSGSYTIVALPMNTNANEYVNGIFIYASASSIQVAFNKGSVSLRARAFAR